MKECCLEKFPLTPIAYLLLKCERGKFPETSLQSPAKNGLLWNSWLKVDWKVFANFFSCLSAKEIVACKLVFEITLSFILLKVDSFSLIKSSLKQLHISTKRTNHSPYHPLRSFTFLLLSELPLALHKSLSRFRHTHFVL